MTFSNRRDFLLMNREEGISHFSNHLNFFSFLFSYLAFRQSCYRSPLFHWNWSYWLLNPNSRLAVLTPSCTANQFFGRQNKKIIKYISEKNEKQNIKRLYPIETIPINEIRNTTSLLGFSLASRFVFRLHGRQCCFNINQA